MTVQVQPNNYAAFYDDSRQSWSLAFESELSLIQLAKQVVWLWGLVFKTS